MVPFSSCCSYEAVGRIGMKIFNFIVLSLLLLSAAFSLLTLAKPICLFFSFNVRELELNWCSKDQSIWGPLCVKRWNHNFPNKVLRFVKRNSLSLSLSPPFLSLSLCLSLCLSLPLSILSLCISTGMRLPDVVQSKWDFYQWYVSWNELKLDQMS